MAYFRCSTGGSGGKGADLVITCDSVFAGSTITVTDGTKTLTQQCPSSSPYEVTIKSIPTGTWTVSGTYSGQTFSTTVTVADFTALLASIPDGSTVTPTDDVQILLHCANIWDKAYTTVSALLADTTSLLAVISDTNAVDYLVRSTTFASDICADSTAMTDIGANNYAADTLLADSTWCTAICNSTYFESVLNVKVPTMTSNTTPSGIASCDNTYGPDAYKAFDGVVSMTSEWASNGLNSKVIYKFTDAVQVSRVRLQCAANANQNEVQTFKVQYSDDGSAFYDASSQLTFVTSVPSTAQDKEYILLSYGKHLYWAILAISPMSGAIPSYVIRVSEAQFYGRVDV